MFDPKGLKDRSVTPLGGKSDGLAYLVPNPAEKGYACMNGVLIDPTAMSVCEKSTPKALPAGKVAGFVYFVPKPLDQG
jgi:hypothetical protein